MQGWKPFIGWRSGDRRVTAAPVNPIPDAANLRVWLDGDDIDGSNNSTLINGVGIASWLNKGTLGGTMVQATGANQPLFKANALNGKGGAEFDGVRRMSSSLPMSSFAFLHDGTGATIYTVVKTSTSAVHTIFSTASGGGTAIGVLHRYNTGFAASYAMNDGVALRIAVNGAAASVNNGNFDIYTSTLASADTPDCTLHVNGTSVATANSAGFTASDPSSTLILGATPSSTFHLVGDKVAGLIFAGSHDAPTRAAVLAYLQTLYGVSFPSP